MKKYPEFPFKLRVLFHEINMQMIYTCRKSTKKPRILITFVEIISILADE